MLDVKVKISLAKPVGSLDWGYPLILSKETTAKPYTVCTSLEEVVTAGYAETTDTYKAAAIMFTQNTPPAKIAVCAITEVSTATLATIKDYEWRQLVTVGDIEPATVKTFIDTTDDKMYFAGITSVSEIADIKESNRIVAVVHETESALAAAAVAAVVAGNDVGSITYKNLIIKGVTPETLTAAELEAIHSAFGITILKKAGDTVTSEGFVTSGEYADVIDCNDYVIHNLTYKTQKVLNTMGKIPYDNRGIAILENVAVDVMKDAFNKGMIAVDDDGAAKYAVSYALRSEVAADDIVKRKYTGGKFAFTISGGIHEVDVNGEISVM